MTTHTTTRAASTPHETLHTLIDEVGTLRVLAMLAVNTLTPPRRLPTQAADLSPHLRRDVGLPPRYEPPPFRGPFL